MTTLGKDMALSACHDQWHSKGFVSLSFIYRYAKTIPLVGSVKDCSLLSCRSFNCSDDSLGLINTSSDDMSDFARLELKQYLADNSIDHVPYHRISSEQYLIARKKLLESPDTYMTHHLKSHGYPHWSPRKTYSFNPEWVVEQMQRSADLFRRFSATRRSDTAILVGNGPSLNYVDLELFRGQDVFISNYAVKSEAIARYARGVAVTNYLVAEQEPYWFQLNQLWKFYPVWLAATLPPSKTSVLLNAIGGELFFSEDVINKVAWHSTVSYFWLQILYSAGYRKVVMTGFDHFYHQEQAAREGDLIKQSGDDRNHFDPNYFKGKIWQAADVSKMEDTYRLAKEHYQADRREIVNATVGGHLEVFRRSALENEIDRPRLFGRITRAETVPKVAIVTAFWRGDVAQAELHWRLINKLGVNSAEHIYVFKHSKDFLPPTTLPRVVCADIEVNYPDAAYSPHPAGPNLVFSHVVRMLLDTDYTHFFWLEPDCIPTSRDFLQPFMSCLSDFPDEPIIGTGGGTVIPGKPHWRNHFAGCSLYSLKHLAEVDWERFITYQLDVSFDAWLSVSLGYIRLDRINNEDQTSTIIFGNNRYDWTLLKRPKALVYSMFDHWRPEKIMTPEQLEERLFWPDFSLYHSLKDRDVLVRLFQRIRKTASTIIINYNNEKYLLDAIHSALNQRIAGIEHEVVVVDDGSTDGSRRIIDRFAGRVKPVFLTHGILNGNFNQQRALKAGLEVATGEILLLLDGDDLFFPEKVQLVCEVFDDPDVVLVQHALKLIDGDGRPLDKEFRAFPEELITPEIYQKFRKVNFFQGTSGLAFRRSYIHSQLDRLCVDNHLDTWLDVRLTRFSLYFGKVCSVGNCLGAWRRHAQSDSIRTDNVAERIMGHERWYDDVATREGFPTVPFKWK